MTNPWSDEAVTVDTSAEESVSEVSEDTTAAEETPEETAETPEDTQDDVKPDGEETETQEGEESEDAEKPDSEEEKDSEVNPDLLKFAEAKGYSAEDLKSPLVQKAVESQKSMEANMNRLQNELNSIKEKGLADDSKKIEQEQAQEQQPKTINDLRPVERVKALRDQAFQVQCQIHGCNNPNELAQVAPQAYSYILESYNEAKEDAFLQEMDLRDKERAEADDKAKAEQRLNDEGQMVANTYRENVLDAKKDNPNIESQLQKSGVMPFVNQLAKLTQVPMEYIMADKDFFQAMAGLAEKASFDKDGYAKELRTDWEKKLQSVKSEELPGSEPMPTDGMDLKTKLQKIGAGVSMAE